MSTVLTSPAPAAQNTAVLGRLAERWRPAGLYLACLGRDGTLLWHDNQMPRLLASCVALDPALAAYLKSLPEVGESSKTIVRTALPGVALYLLPVIRRRKVSAYLAGLARTGDVPFSEELQRFAGRAALDASGALAQLQKAPTVSAAQAPILATLALDMYEDLSAATLHDAELSGVTEQLSSVYEEISLLYKISSGMRFSQKPQAFLESVCAEVQELGSFRAVVVAFARRNDETSAPTIGDLAVIVGDCPLGGNELVHALHSSIMEALTVGETRVVNALDSGAGFAEIRQAMQRFVCVPLIRDERPLGVLLAVDKLDHGEFNSVDIKLLNNVGSQCSIFLENAQLYQDMQSLFMGVLHALTRSIDAKDAYTRGHSQRVATLSRDLARKMGLPDEQCERVYLSGLLHDVGKIGVPEAVLTKPGRLSDAEFEAIKKHPAIGAQILGNIKQLTDIIPGVLYHHERWDGRGYPYNLAAEAIPLIGRIICVADSFDAMSSTRTYRPALPIEHVLSEIERCAGTQFDPALARVFVTLDFTQYQKAIDEQLPPKPVEMPQ